MTPRPATEWSRPPRAPLGVLYSGECHACRVPAPAEHPLCNFGYARGECPRFPADAAADAVRFVRDGEEVRYVAESEHVPVESGPVQRGGETVLEAQARAFQQTSAQR